jgi:hypothetical protein
MADQNRRTDETAAQPQEENAGQRQSDATPDVVGGRELAPTESSDREGGRGSDANGTPAFDEVEGDERRKLYEKGATLVSKID